MDFWSLFLLFFNHNFSISIVLFKRFRFYDFLFGFFDMYWSLKDWLLNLCLDFWYLNHWKRGLFQDGSVV